MSRAALVLAVLCSCGRIDPAEDPLGAAAQFLIGRQSADGSFPSQDIGLLRSGYSLTALVLHAFAACPSELVATHRSDLDRAFEFLRAGTADTGAIGLDATVVDYPNYTSALYLRALCDLRPANWRALADRQVEYFRTVQLCEPRGWSPDDVEYGGFGFGGRIQDKPSGAGLLSVSITAFVLEALRAAGVNPDDPLFAKARVFLERCQRMPPEGDGGFVWTTAPAHDVSKVEDAHGNPVTYGSATADGLRALQALGDDSDRTEAAAAWLRRNWTVERTPGITDANFETALRLYWYATAARVANRTGIEAERIRALRTAVLELQRADGSWVGFSALMKEDDPLVATPLCMLALVDSGP